jgi:hypothetical protein
MKQQFRKCALVTALVAVAFGSAGSVVTRAQTPQVPENDPFFKPAAPKKVTKNAPKPADKWQEVPFPSLEQRGQEFQMERARAKERSAPEPNPVGQFLVRELRVLGIYEIDDKTGVFVEAGPNKQTYFLTECTRLYNGELLDVIPGEYPSPGRALFREKTDFTMKKQRKTDIQEVTKVVGQASS